MSNIPPALLAHLTQRVGVLVASGEDAYANLTFASAVTVRARVDYRMRRVATVGGVEVLSGITVYCEDVPALTAEGKVTLPDGSTRKILNVSRLLWPGGAQHLELALD